MNIILKRLKLFNYMMSLKLNDPNLNSTDKIRSWASEIRRFYNAILRNKANRIEKRHIPILMGDPYIYVSDEYKFAWHVMFKAGSNSIAKIVRTLCDKDDDDTENILLSPYCIQPCQFLGPSWVEAKKFKPKYKYESYRHFVVVRNPWSRLVSTYHMIRQHKTYGAYLMDQYKIENIYPMKFEDFVKFVENIPDGYCDSHFLPYHYHINLQKTDFVGKFENFEDDMRHVLNIIAPDQHIEIPKLNTSEYEKKSYRDYYTDETREIVARKYAKDIELFDYQF